MLTIWKNKGHFQQINKFERNCWINVTSPSPEEVDRLIEEFRVPDYYINDILDVDERSRMDVEGRWLLIIIRVPVFRNHSNLPFVTVPLGVLISAHSVITLCIYENEVLRDMLNPMKNKNMSIESKSNFVLELFLRSSNQYLKYLKEINIRINNTEQELEKSTKNSEIQNLLKMEKCLLFFITSLKSNEILLTKLQRSRFARVEVLDEDLLADVYTETKQAIEMSQITSEIQAALMDTFASIVSNNLNVVMKQLTSITIILMIPTLISSFFGMNLTNHFESSTTAFVLVAIVSIVISIVTVMLFRRRNWF